MRQGEREQVFPKPGERATLKRDIVIEMRERGGRPYILARLGRQYLSAVPRIPEDFSRSCAGEPRGIPAEGRPRLDDSGKAVVRRIFSGACETGVRRISGTGFRVVSHAARENDSSVNLQKHSTTAVATAVVEVETHESDRGNSPTRSRPGCCRRCRFPFSVASTGRCFPK
jgi:hypothetical protein